MSNYWRKRELEHLDKIIRDEKRLTRKLTRNKLRAMREIEREIEAFYGRYASAEGITMEEARKRVARAEINKYKSKAKRYVKEKNFTQRANEEMRLYNVTMRINRLELLKANIHLELLALTSEEQRILLDELTKVTRAEFKRQSAILGMTLKYNEKMIKDIVNSSFFNATWSDRLWDNQDALRAELDRLLNRGIVQGLNPRELARELRKQFDTNTYNSERLLRTELARVQTDVFEDTMEQTGAEQFEWIAEPTACKICSKLDGQIFDKDELEIAVTAPPAHPNCMCGLALYVDRDEWEAELKRRGL